MVSIRIKCCLSSSITDHVQSYLEWDLREYHDPTATTAPKPFVMHYSLAETCFPPRTGNLLQSHTESREINYLRVLKVYQEVSILFQNNLSAIYHTTTGRSLWLYKR